MWFYLEELNGQDEDNLGTNSPKLFISVRGYLNKLATNIGYWTSHILLDSL